MAKHPPQSLGQSVRSARGALDITQLELAIRAKTTPQTIQRIERDTANPNLALLKRVAQALGKSVGDLVGEEVA